MEKWIKSISGKIPYTNKIVNINLDGKNLIVTGANGTGKTSFLKAAYEKVFLLVVPKEFSKVFQKTNRLNVPEIELEIDIPDRAIFSSMYKERKAVIQLFEEKRLSEIKQPTTAKAVSVEENIARGRIGQKFANNLEQHLVNLKSRQALAITEKNDRLLANDIECWFVNFENNLKILFEDENIKLKFDPDNFHFSICQPNKPPYSFQTFSAGYRAIFDIYAELIMRAEYFKVTPRNLTGVVFIDEIDSHLHVSLQRLILPFFTESFPEIQFVVTTHSPFVLMSTPNTVVFDLAQNEPITEDLSYYTYSAVMKGLWNVKPISVKLENTIEEIAEIVNSDRKDFSRLRQLIDKVQGHENSLDNESKAFYLLGLETLENSGDRHV